MMVLKKEVRFNGEIKKDVNSSKKVKRIKDDKNNEVCASVVSLY